jgi:hypothetical protein
MNLEYGTRLFSVEYPHTQFVVLGTKRVKSSISDEITALYGLMPLYIAAKIRDKYIIAGADPSKIRRERWHIDYAMSFATEHEIKEKFYTEVIDGKPAA